MVFTADEITTQDELRNIWNLTFVYYFASAVVRFIIAVWVIVCSSSNV